MIKVNYNNDGTVYAFGLNKEPYIEVAEEELNQKIEDNSYYAVVDGKFTIKRRNPTKEELEADNRQVVEREISELKRKLSDTDYKAIKYAEGFLTEEEYKETKAQRQIWRDRINELEVL